MHSVGARSPAGLEGSAKVLAVVPRRTVVAGLRTGVADGDRRLAPYAM